ncbi:MAG TPA: septum formation initiator family protein [Chitinophagales bacterium]|nr:septum formation initiator family protein [Chitinophagales bacterium]
MDSNQDKDPFYRDLFSKLPNKYLLILVVYFVYMLVFDSNDLRSQFRLWKEVKALKKEKVLLQQTLIEVTNERDKLLTNKKSLETFAREEYYMHSEDETVFVLVEE